MVKEGDQEEMANQKLVIEDLTNKCNSLETDKIELAGKLDELAKLVESHKQTIEEFEIKCSSLETVSIELTAKLDGATEAHAQKIEELEVTLGKELSEKWDESALLVESQKQAIKEYDIKCNNFETVIMELTQKLDESANLIESQKKAIEELETKCKSLEETKVEQTSSLDKSTECQNHEIEELKNKYPSLETMRMELAVKLDETAQLTENQKLAIEELNTECTNLKSELEVANILEKLCNQVSSEATEISQLNEEKTKLLAELNNIDEESESTECKSLRKEMGKLEEDNASHLSELQKSQHLYKKIDEMKEALQASIDENGNVKIELNEIKDQLQSCLEQKGEADLKLEKLEEEFQATLVKNSNLNQELIELQSELKASEQQGKSFLKQFLHVKEILDVIVPLNSAYEQELTKLKEELKYSHDHGESESTECKSLRKEMRKLEEDDASYLSELQKSEADLKLEKLKEECQASLAKNSNLKTELNEIQNALKASELQGKTYLKQFLHVKEVLDVLIPLNSSYEQELTKLKEELKFSDDHGEKLLNCLGKIDLLASENCLKYSEEIEDLKRQVNEKEAIIEQLEKGIKDCQKVKKDNEAKLENQILPSTATQLVKEDTMNDDNNSKDLGMENEKVTNSHCDKCHTDFDDSDQFVGHKCPSSPFPCSVCSENFDFNHQLNIHMKNAHESETSDSKALDQMKVDCEIRKSSSRGQSGSNSEIKEDSYDDDAGTDSLSGRESKMDDMGGETSRHALKRKAAKKNLEIEKLAEPRKKSRGGERESDSVKDFVTVSSEQNGENSDANSLSDSKEESKDASLAALTRALPDNECAVLLQSLQPTNSFKCTKCHKTFRNYKLAATHFTSCKCNRLEKNVLAFDEVRWVCTHCSSLFMVLFDFLKHKKMCSNSSEQIGSLKRNLLTRAKELLSESCVPFNKECLDCYHSSTALCQNEACRKLLQYMASCTVCIRKLPIVDVRSSAYLYECRDCKEVFTDNRLYLKHVEGTHNCSKVLQGKPLLLPPSIKSVSSIKEEMPPSPLSEGPLSDYDPPLSFIPELFTLGEQDKKQPQPGTSAQSGQEPLKSDDKDFEPVRRSNRKKKSDDKDFEPVRRSNRRKINEDTSENMLPVQRAISFEGSKFRNVAQAISAPRMTRGRYKLFNNEPSTAANPAWKY